MSFLQGFQQLREQTWAETTIMYHCHIRLTCYYQVTLIDSTIYGIGGGLFLLVNCSTNC